MLAGIWRVPPLIDPPALAHAMRRRRQRRLWPPSDEQVRTRIFTIKFVQHVHDPIKIFIETPEGLLVMLGIQPLTVRNAE